MRELASLRQISSIDEEEGGPKISLTPKITAFQKSNNPQYVRNRTIWPQSLPLANINHTSHSAHFLDVLPDGPAGSWHFRFHQLRNERPQSSVLTHGRIPSKSRMSMPKHSMHPWGRMSALSRARSRRQTRQKD